MSLFTGVGEEAKLEGKKKIDLKDAFIRLKKSGDKVAVKVVGGIHKVSYKAHSDFKRGFYNTACLAVNGEMCPYCVAEKSGLADWKDFYAKNRAIFAFGDLESGEVKLIELSQNQGKKLADNIKEYAEEIEEGSVLFNLTRTGEGTDTAYTLNLMTPKQAKAYEDKAKVFEDAVVDVQFFADRLAVRSTDYMVKLLADAGFPVEKHFDAELVAKAMAEQEGQEPAVENTPIEDMDAPEDAI